MTQTRQFDDMAVRLRSYRRGDLDAMYRLDVACFAAAFRFSRRAMREFAETENAHVTVAEVAGEFAGFCILHVEEVDARRVGYIVTLDVAAAYRRTGVASALTGAMESQAEAEGCGTLLLHVHDGNAGALRFYARRGFVPLREEPGFYGRGLDAQIWVKPLRG